MAIVARFVVTVAGVLPLLFAAACGAGESSPAGAQGGTAATGRSPSGGSAGSSAPSGGAPGSAGSSSGGTLPQSGGAATGGVPGAGTAGTAGGVDGDATRYRLCVEYARRRCGRLYTECGDAGREQSCVDSLVRECPDSLFSAGANLTIAWVEQCIRSWQEVTCEELRAGVLAVCEYDPGSALDGEPCLFSSQCASQRCDAGADACGVCAPSDCSNVTCAANLECYLGTCVSRSSISMPPGEPCTATFACTTGHVCLPTSGGGDDTCQPVRSIGTACTSSPECEPSAYCAIETGLCTASPPAGSACAEDDWGYVRGCSPGNICNESASPLSCEPRVAQGEACWVPTDITAPQGNCVDGLRCECTQRECASRTCLRILDEGASCGEPYTACIPGTACSDGVCVPAGSQGLFEAACGQ